jgi:hypothetical protein
MARSWLRSTCGIARTWTALTATRLGPPIAPGTTIGQLRRAGCFVGELFRTS